jgi:hypothetical protein
MYNTQYPLLLNQHNGDDAPQDCKRVGPNGSKQLKKLSAELLMLSQIPVLRHGIARAFWREKICLTQISLSF